MNGAAVDAPRPVSATTARARALVAARLPRAQALGRSLADEIGQPESFAARLRAGLAELADEEYRQAQPRVAPGIGPVLGVRSPLLSGVARSFAGATRHDRPSSLLYLAERLFREDVLEPRWFAFGLLERLLASDPERAWQLLRRAGREARDWVTVDSLARPFGRGILLEPYRWAELDQLVYSPSRWERRLVGSTIATLPFLDRRVGRQPTVAEHGLGLVGDLVGDREPDVQKALSWALRSLTLVDAAGVTALLAREADLAARAADGHRAWVIRDTLTKIDPARAAELRERLDGVRRRPGSPSTSRAAETAARFGRLPDPSSHPEPPLADDRAVLRATASDRRPRA